MTPAVASPQRAGTTDGADRLSGFMARRTSPKRGRHARKRPALRWTRRSLAALGLGVCGVLGGAGAAWSYWGADAAVGGSGASAAASVAQGATPTASAGVGPNVTVNWSATALTSGEPVTGYIVKRYDADTMTLQSTLTGCSGTVAAVTCTETTVPAGEWRYSITPAIGTNWRGQESLHSGVVTVSPAVLTLATSVFGPPLPRVTTGTLTGFSPNEGITYRLDAATPLTGTPATADAAGNATITGLTMPSGVSEGAHTIYAVGSAGTIASVAVIVDTVAPTASAQLSPAANAAGWNNAAAVQVILTGADGVNGSGISQIRYTTDGTDPTSSGSAQSYTDLLLTSSTTVRFYAIDAAGNASGVYTQLVKVDTVAPVNAVTVSNANGNAYQSDSTVYYRGSAPSNRSFTLTNAVTDPGGSGPASSGTAALSGTTTGWTHTSSSVAAPASGPYVSSAYTWALNTTSSPTANVVGTDVAGNTATSALSFVDDSTTPAGGSISYDDSSTSVFSVPIGFTTGTDAASGLAPSQRLLQRRAVALTNGACASFTGVNYTTIATDPASPYTDTTVTSGNCYQYQYVVPDRVGNQAAYTSAYTVKVSTYASAVNSTTGLRSHWRLGELNTKDRFAGSAGTSPTARASDSGATWTAKSGTTPVISSAGRIRKNGATGFDLYSSAVPPSADYSVEADLYVASAVTGQFVDVIGRWDPATWNYYHAGYNTTSGAWVISKEFNGAYGTVGTSYTQTLTAGQTYRVRLEMMGTSISLWVNGVRRVTGTDSSITAAGRAGFQIYGAATHSDSAGIHIDEFVAAPLTAADSKGTNHGTYTNTPINGETGPLTNDSDTAVRFDAVGSVDHVAVPHATTLNVGDSFSLEAWVKRADAATTMQTIVHKGTTTTGFQWGFLNNKMGLFKNGVAIAQTTTSQTDTTLYHHYVVTKNGGTVKLYVDGVDVTGFVTNQTIADTSSPLYIGAEVGTAEGLNGTIDEVSLYSGALSAATVTDHHQYYTTSQYAKVVAAEPSLLRQYRFGELNHAIDTFAGTAGAAIDSRVGEFGATWVRQASSDGNAVLTAGADVRKSGTTKGALYYTSTMPPTEDYKVDALTQYNASTYASSAAVVGRLNPATNSYYMVRRDNGASASSCVMKLVKVVNGVETAVGAHPTNGNTTYACPSVTANYRIGLDMDGSVIRAQNNGGPFLVYDDPSPLPNGYGAIMVGDVRAAATTTQADADGLQVDQFRINPPAEDSNDSTNNGDFYETTTLGTVGALVGDADTAVQFSSATSDFARLPPITLDDFTVEFWFKSSAAVTSALLDVDDGTQYSGTDWGIRLDGTGKLAAWVDGPDYTAVTSASSYNNGVWHHVAFTRVKASGAMSLYVDGRNVAAGTGPTATLTANKDIRVARTSQLGSSPLEGAIDELALYSTALPFTTVSKHYDLGMGRNGDGPTGGSVDATALVGTNARYKTSTSFTLALAKGTDTSGVAATGAQLRRSQATLSSAGVADGSCGVYNDSVFVATDPALSYPTTVPAAGACYRYEYIVADGDGNTTTYFSDDIKIDDSAANAPALTYSNLSNVYAANGTSTVYYRPTATSGSFTVSATSSDVHSGIGGYTMPSLGAGWTTPSGTTGTQTYSFASSSPTTASGSVTAYNGAAMTSGATALTMTADSAGPSVTGMSLTYTNGAHSSGALNVTISGTPTDGGSGLGNGLLQRAVAPLTSGTCGTYGSFTTIATNPSSPYADSVSNAYCYKYQYLVYDKVGNAGTPVVHSSGAAAAARVSTVAKFFQTGTSNLVVMEAENFSVDNVQGADDWALDTANAGYSGAGSMATPDTAGMYGSPGYATTASRLDYEVNFATTGTHYVWVRGWNPNGGADSAHVGLDYLENATADNITVSSGTPSWQWTNINYDNATPLTITVPTTGLHTLNLYVREAGFVVDKLLLTTSSSYTPTGTGPGETVGELLSNGDFDDASSSPWSGSGATVTSGTPYRSATKKLVLGGANSVNHTAYQTVTIPSTCTTPTLRFYRYVTTNENSGDVYDYLYLDVRNSANSSTLQSYTAANNGNSASWVQNSYSLTSYKGQTVTLRFRATTDGSLTSTFYVDDASLTCS